MLTSPASMASDGTVEFEDAQGRDQSAFKSMWFVLSASANPTLTMIWHQFVLFSSLDLHADVL